MMNYANKLLKTDLLILLIKYIVYVVNCFLVEDGCIICSY